MWAHVYDGSPPQTNIVRMNGRRGVLMTILKSGQTSTLDIVNNVRALIPRLKQTLPSSLKIVPLADQSIFVRAAISGVVREGVIAAALTGSDDPVVPGQLALDPDHRDLDSAGDPVFDRRCCRRWARPSI